MKSVLTLLLGTLLGGIATLSFARNVPSLPEPSILSILGIGAVAGIVVWRIRRKK